MASPDDSIIYYPSLMFCHCPNGQDTPHPNFTFSASARYKRRKKSRATLTQCDFEPWSGFFSFLNRRRGGEEGHGTHMPHFSFLAWVDKFFFARDPKKILFPIVSPPPPPLPPTPNVPQRRRNPDRSHPCLRFVVWCYEGKRLISLLLYLFPL